MDIGFNGSHTGTNTNPTAFTLNGTTCTVTHDRGRGAEGGQIAPFTSRSRSTENRQTASTAARSAAMNPSTSAAVVSNAHIHRTSPSIQS